MLPFYHPTSIVALDDDSLFLESFAFHFGDDFICNTFTQPEQALGFFEERRALQPLGNDFFTSDTGLLDRSDGDTMDPLIKMDGAQLVRMMGDATRFQQISLLVVDFAMPGMNGIEVCRRLKGHPACKILLTGKAGEETAVKAFNEGIIDCFLMKQMPDLPRVLDHEMRKLQRKYFTELTAPVQMALGIQSRDLSTHALFSEHFLKIFEARGVVEYYLQTKPSGFVMLNDGGEQMFLVVQDSDTVRSSIEIARDQDAPEEFIALLESGSVIAFFPGSEHAYHSEFSSTWRDHIWPAHKIEGTPVLHVSLLSGDDVTPYVTAPIAKFSDFRDAHDNS